MRIAIGSDHAGYELKQIIVGWLANAGYDHDDFGTYSTESCDYPDIARQVAAAVSSGAYERGVLICGTGIGMAITANKVPGVRAALCTESYSARMSREHNDANVLCIGSRVVGPGLAEEIASVWLTTGFSEDPRHRRRVDKIRATEQAT